MQIPKKCGYCESKAVRIVRVNSKGREVTFTVFWVFLGFSMLILISSFFGAYGNSSNHLVLALPGLILVLTSVFCLLLVARMPKKFKCENSHTWE
jgi:hypothetical protein